MSDSKTFWEYLKSETPNHLKVIGIVACVAGVVITYNYIRDLKAQRDNATKVADTLSQKLQSYSNGAAVAGNAQQKQPDVQQQAVTAFGPDLTSYMKAQNATIQSLTALVAQQAAKTTAIQVQPNEFTPKQNDSGKLTGYVMEEQRGGAPPLSSVNIFYDPSQKDPNKAFAGTSWTHYQETFKASVGDWVKQSDGSFRTSVSAITRTVTKPDPNDPTKTVTVGSEQIPVIDAQTIYTPKGLLAGSTQVVPRWTLTPFISKDSKNGYQPGATIDYRLTDRFGLSVGAVNQAPVAGISIRLGGGK